jgi:hypothetical protein
MTIAGPNEKIITAQPAMMPMAVPMPTKHPGRRVTMTCDGTVASSSARLPAKR